MSAMQPPICHLLRIPQELRDEIYAYYLGDEGYHHHPESNTLRCNDGTAIGLALVLTCKQVAAEMAGLPLKLNAVTFKTRMAPKDMKGDSSAPNSRAGRFHFLSDRLYDLEAEACSVAFDAYGTKELVARISEEYPQSCIGNHLKRMLQARGRDYSLPILRRHPVKVTYYDRQVFPIVLQHASASAGLPYWLRSPIFFRCLDYVVDKSFYFIYRRWRFSPMYTQYASGNALEIISSKFPSSEWPPWIVPTTSGISELRDIIFWLDTTYWLKYGWGLDRIRFYESGTSQCIRFLGILQQNVRLRLRHLVIREDRKPCAVPQSHAYGLIPYLRDLPCLRVDHHVDMWHTIFLDPYQSSQSISTCSLSDAVSGTINWISEALHLRHAGMPSSAYRLHFEAPIHNVEHIWGTIKSHAAFYHASAQHYHETEVSSLRSGYKIDCRSRLVLLVRLILSGDPTVQLPCSIGTLKEFEEEVDHLSTKLRGEPEEIWEQYLQSLTQGDLHASGYDFTAVNRLYVDYP